MRKKFLPFFLIFFLFFVIPSLVFILIKDITGKVIEEKEGIEISLNKEEFFPYETLLLALKTNQNFDLKDIKIRREGMIMPVQIYKEKINNQIFAYAVLSLSPASYNITITMQLPSGIKLIEKEIKIKETSNAYYIQVFNAVKDRWHLLRNKELIYAMQAISGMDSLQDERALNEILARINSFNDYEKALALFTIISENDAWLLQKTKLINYFLAIQDNNRGKFEIKIKNNANLLLKCKSDKINVEISPNSEKIFEIGLLNETKLNLSFVCNKFVNGNVTNASISDANANLTKEFFGIKKVYVFNKSEEENENVKAIKFSLEKEFGGINDDQNLTALVLLGFLKHNVIESSLSSWLKKNAQTIISYVALAHLNDAEAIDYLLSVQQTNGSLPSMPSTNFSFSQAEISCLAYQAMPTKSLIIDWVSKNFASFNLIDKSSCLDFAFTKQKIISIMPGVIKVDAGKSFELLISNKGISDTDVKIENLLLNLNYTTNIKKEQTKKLTIAVPAISSQSNIEDKIVILYDANRYDVPLFVFVSALPNATITNVTNATNISITNVTIGESIEEKAEKPEILEISVQPEKIDINLTGPTEFKFKIKNVGKEKVENIILWSSASLFGIVKRIEPAIINQLSPNEEKEITLALEIGTMPSYEGTVTIEGIVEGKNYRKEIEVKLTMKAIPNGALMLSCAELNGKICKAGETCEGVIKSSRDGACCIGKCTSKSKRLLGIIFLIIGIIIIAAAIFVLRRKPKAKRIEEVIKKIEEKEKEKAQSTPTKPFIPKAEEKIR
ncbi:MAG: hypothetical protein QW622_03075 [Candidatus Pacearchaeota archaeon]